jgi:hypothetical protein
MGKDDHLDDADDVASSVGDQYITATAARFLYGSPVRSDVVFVFGLRREGTPLHDERRMCDVVELDGTDGEVHEIRRVGRWA